MFKNEIKFITDLSVSKLNNKNKLFTLDDIKKSKIHPAIVKYIDAYVELQIFIDIQSLNRNSNFDYTGSKVSKYLKLISEDIKRSQKFQLEELIRLIHQAVIFNINYLTRPNKTIVEFIFGKAQKKNLSEITQNLLFVYYYRFLPKILLAYLTKKKIKAISKVEFSILLRKIDATARKNHLQGTINTAVNSMVNFFDVGSLKAERVPVQAVEFFLKEKGLKSYYKKLNNEFSDDNSKVFLGLVIKDTLNSVVEEDAVDEKDNRSFDEEKKVKEEHKPIDIEVDEQQIPNEELLSNDSDLEKQDKKNIAGGILAGALAGTSLKDNIIDSNNLSSDKEKSTEELKETNCETIIDDSNIIVAKEKVETLEESTIEDPNNIKPDAKTTIKELVDIDKFYDSLSNEPKPSENEMLKTSINEDSIDNLSKLSDYQIDTSDLDTEFNIPDELEMNIETIEVQSIYAKDEEPIESNNEKMDITSEEIEDSNNELEQFKHTENRKNIVDEYINNIKEEKLSEDDVITSEDIDSKTIFDESEVGPIFKNESAKSDEITLTEEISEEKSEVFSDIPYLEKDEIEDVFDEDITETKIEEKTTTEEKTEIESISDLNSVDSKNEDTTTEVLTDTKTTTTTKTFTEVVAENDMSTIIETVFDYDMDDYHDMIINLANTKIESDAIQLVDNYCSKNSVSLTMIDVTSFKTLISNYFTNHPA